MAARGAEHGQKRACLTARRRWAGHTQESLAEELGVDTSTVRRWEHGLSTPNPRRRGPLAHALEIDLGELDGLLRCRSACRHGHASPDKTETAERQHSSADLDRVEDT